MIYLTRYSGNNIKRGKVEILIRQKGKWFWEDEIELNYTKIQKWQHVSQEINSLDLF